MSSDVATLFRDFARLERLRSERGLTPEEIRRWAALKRKLTDAFSPGLSDEQADMRRSIRVPTQLRVQFRDDDHLQRLLMTQLSRGGVYIETDYPVEIGTRLALRIEIAATGETLEVGAEVVSHNVGPSLDGWSRGMGLRFVDLSEEVQQRIDSLYEEKLEELAKNLS